MRAMTRKRSSAWGFGGGAVLAAIIALAAAAPVGAADQSVSLIRTPGGSVINQPTGPVMLTATFAGTGNEYQFWYSVKTATSNYDWFIACDWSTANICTLNGGADITTTGKYTFQAYARRPGSTSYDAYSAGDRADIVSPDTPSGNYPDDWFAYPRTLVYFGWTAPADMTGVTGYDIEIDNKDDGDGVPHQHVTINNPSAVTASVNLVAGYSYRWWVRTIVGAGNGPYSTEKNFAIAVPRPIAPAANAFITAANANFSWSPVTPGNGYELSLDDLSTPGTVPDTTAQVPGNLSLNFTLPLTPDTDYQWWVKATGVVGAGISNPITFYSGPTKVGIGNVSNPGVIAQGAPYPVTWTSRSVPAAAVADIWYYRGSIRQWVLLNGAVSANADTFSVFIPSLGVEPLAQLWVGACSPGQVSGGRCTVYSYGSAIGGVFTVTP